MTATWLDALVEPQGVASKRLGQEDPRYGLALLVSGRFREYESARLEVGWPGLGEGAAEVSGSDTSLLLLRALCGHLSGDGTTLEMYTSLSTGRDVASDLRVVAAVLGGVAAADAGSPGDAVARLTALFRETTDPLQRMLLSIHAGVRAAEAGDAESAVAATEQVMAELPADRASRHQRELFRAIARHNRWHFSVLIDLATALRSRPLPRRSRFEPLNQIDLLVGDALSSYLEDQFDTALRDPYTRTLSWQVDDPIEQPLIAALLRAECLGDWDSLRRARRLVGRYQLLSDVAAESARPSGFQLLRRTGDRAGLERAARLFSRVGPLEALRDSASSVVAQAWPPLEQTAILALIREGADLLDERMATRAMRRILGDHEMITRHPGEVFPTLARLERVASSDAREELATQMLALTATTNTLMLQSMQPVLRNLDWSAVPDNTQSPWLRYLRAHLGDRTDAQFAAAALALGFSRAGVQKAQPLVEEVFDQRPSLDIAGLLVDTVGAVRRPTRAHAVRMARESIINEQKDAAKGHFGFGTINVSALLAALLVGTVTDDESWEVLTSYLLDPNVAGDGKASALNRLTASGAVLPPNALRRLREKMHDFPAYSDAWISPPYSLAGSVLRFGIHIKAFGEADGLARLLDLVGDRTVEARLEGVRSLEVAARVLSAETVTTLALSLTADDDHNVRSEAARETAALPVDLDPVVLEIIVERLSRLVTEKGVVVPLGVLTGLKRARPSAAMAQLLETAASVGSRHLSARVRRAAAELVADKGQ